MALPGGREKAKIGITVSSCLITQWHRIPCIEAHLTDTDKSFYNIDKIPSRHPRTLISYYGIWKSYNLFGNRKAIILTMKKVSSKSLWPCHTGLLLLLWYLWYCSRVTVAVAFSIVGGVYNHSPTVTKPISTLLL